MLKHTLCAGAIALAPMPSIAEQFDATIVAGHPAVFRWVRMINEVFIPEVTASLEGTEHEITFSEQYGGAVAGVGEELETVSLGLAEIGVIQSLFDPATLAVQNVTYYTPFVTDDPREIYDLLHDLHLNNPMMRQAYDDNDITYLGAPVVIDDYLLMTTFPINDLSDLDGRRIAAPGPAVNWLSGTGAVGVSGNLTTYYNELSTGVYDGVVVFASAALPGRLYEVAPYVTRFGLGAQFAGSLGANSIWYDSLPPEAQQALHDAADAAGGWYLDALDSAVETSLETMAAEGATVTVASAELRQTWADGMDNAAATWADELEAQGRPAREILSIYMNGMRDAGAEPLRNWDQE
ncbi:MAG: C4-dicarboxylate TRAP transporter substrate-binding protein [Pseudomonadota bacterium]